MKLVIRFCTAWGNYITSLIEIFDISDYGDIKKNIESKFGIKPNQQLLKFKRDGYTVNSKFSYKCVNYLLVKIGGRLSFFFL